MTDTNSPKRTRVTLKALHRKKAEGVRITAIGVYDAPMAAIADRVGFDLLIVGNAGPMSLLGHPDPTSVTFEEQLFLTRAVSRVAKYGIIVGHLPFMTYHASKEQAITSAARMVREGGAHVVKCEGNAYTAAYIAEIVRAGVPVMGHIGMQASRRVEQSGFGIKGRTAAEAREIVATARAFVAAGVFGFIVEQVPTELAAYLTRTLPVPVITLGGGPINDGVYHISGDLVGYTAFPTPRNRGAYANISADIETAMTRFRDDCLAHAYPSDEQSVHIDAEEWARLSQDLA
ncbi:MULTISPECIES: 3-methyl-2-oxobutanoate hydroxymethyltransferase [Hyphomicrobium]|jgi:3-methyl-2-oxobutanoate hydroxymethyltransferase|uniref:3-methyl-2-oxobutanoate hydroxymethyltransferase n=1 Tax=Hyphomicrobium TaxID=81 RepID=UPI0003606717|nr:MULTISPECIES: 3-methyl-2-oxobutanoate hydroxymethyltransferase [Hyphomicrobium]WBT37127.1 3-methyl-2-oxobutanoate hydroxymethyltransferase [Hyphomicrobium sp. DMF-1]